MKEVQLSQVKLRKLYLLCWNNKLIFVLTRFKSFSFVNCLGLFDRKTYYATSVTKFYEF